MSKVCRASKVLRGEAATITIGNVTTSAPGTPATVTNRGTSSAAVLDFVLPRGKDGADGGVTVDDTLSATSTNPVQNWAIAKEFESLALTSGMLSVPSDVGGYVSKVATDAFSLINNIVQMTIEQSSDGENWETLFDSDIASDDFKLMYLNGLGWSKLLQVKSGYMARVTLATHTTTYFSSVSFFVKAICNSDTKYNIWNPSSKFCF